MSVDKIKQLYASHLEKDDSSIMNSIEVAMITVEELKFLVKEAEILIKIRNEAEELYAEEIDLMDFGERVDNILRYWTMRKVAKKIEKGQKRCRE